MAQVTITINSREYAVACEDGQEVRILQLARLLDEKAKKQVFEKVTALSLIHI